MRVSISSLVSGLGATGAIGALYTSVGATLYAVGRALWVVHKNEGEFRALRHMGLVSLGTVPSMVMIGCYMGRSGMSRLPAPLYGVLGAFRAWSGVTGFFFLIVPMPALALQTHRKVGVLADQIDAPDPGQVIPEGENVSTQKRQLLDDLEVVQVLCLLTLIGFLVSCGVIYCFSVE